MNGARRMSQVFKVISDDSPKLPEKSSVAHIDYQENIEMSQADMTGVQTFGRRKVSAVSQVIDTRWDDIKSDEFTRPRVLHAPNFQHNICRVAMSHFCQESTKHNAHTAAQTLELIIKFVLSLSPEQLALILFSEGSLKEFCNAHFIAL